MADPTRSVIAVLWTCFGLAALGPLTSRADIFAAVCVAAPSGIGQDIAILNASLGTPMALPSAVNTPDTERYPSLSKDGRRLTFQRTASTGSLRQIAVDLATGQSADLYSAFEIAASPIFGSAITPDGTTVATGRPFRSLFGLLFPHVTLTDLRSFPAGPFPKSGQTVTQIGSTAGGKVLGVAAGAGGLLAWQVARRSIHPEEIILTQIGGASSLPLSSIDHSYGQPAMAASNLAAGVIFVDRFVLNREVPLLIPGDIVFRPATVASFVGTPTRLRLGVSTDNIDESQPSLTADGRYIAFVRAPRIGNDRLFVFDTQTQTFLNESGVDLGLYNTRDSCGSTSLYVRTVITASLFLATGEVTATLTGASRIGILVQRIVGKTKVLGRKTYRLETVGRVPLGEYGAGNVFTHWDFEVAGEPLPPGRYLVTLRAVDGDLIREFGEPQVLRIDESGHAHTQGKDDQ